MAREASWDTSAPSIDMAAVGGLAQEAGGKLDSMSRGSRSTGNKVLGTAGEGLRDAGMGAGIGASIGSVIPGLGTVAGGAIGAIAGAITGVVHHLMSGPHRHRRRLTPKDRSMLNRGLRISRTRHRPGAFQDAVLYVYTPDVYRSLSGLKRLPSQIEARLLQQHTYAAHAAAVDRVYGVRLRRELAHLPPELRMLVGVGSVTGHARELYVALHRALAERARLAKQAAHEARERAVAVEQAGLAERDELGLQAAPVSAHPLLEPDAPELLKAVVPSGPEDAKESPEDPFRELRLARDADEGDPDAAGPLDEIALTLEQARRAQRRYLRDSWVNGTWLGDFLHLDQPDDPSAPIAPEPAPTSGRPPITTLVPEPDTGAPPTNTEEARARVLANPPRFPPTSWETLQAPVQVYLWDPFAGQWTHVVDGNGDARARARMLKPLVLLMMVSFDFPDAYCLLHTSRSTEVLRAVKNVSTEPSGDERGGAWQPIGSGVSRMWTPQYTFYARTFFPSEALRFEIGEPAQVETGDPFYDPVNLGRGGIFDAVHEKRPAFALGRFIEDAPEAADAGALGPTYTAQAHDAPQAIAKRYDAPARERWATELKEANPERDWTARIYAGDVLAIPDAWPQPFWGAAKERGFLDASGPTGALPVDTADPFHDLRAQRALPPGSQRKNTR